MLTGMLVQCFQLERGHTIIPLARYDTHRRWHYLHQRRLNKDFFESSPSQTTSHNIVVHQQVVVTTSIKPLKCMTHCYYTNLIAMTSSPRTKLKHLRSPHHVATLVLGLSHVVTRKTQTHHALVYRELLSASYRTTTCHMKSPTLANCLLKVLNIHAICSSKTS